MLKWANKTNLMLAMIAGGFTLMVTPVVAGLSYPYAAVLSSAIIGAVMVLVGIGFGYGSVEWWSRFAVGIGTWTLVAPVLLGFYQAGPAFWAHMGGGLIGLVCGVAAHEMMSANVGAPNRG
jgi:hypothetical protein